MSRRNDGGPAFPLNVTSHEHADALGFEGVTAWSMGMTLRDHFAASVIAGLYASHAGNPPEPEQMAEDAYAIADAMLEARK